MRSPSQVLNNLVDNSKKPNYKFLRLYRNLYNIEFYYEAYQNIYATEGNMTEGTDGKTIDGMSIKRIENLIESIKNESYKPNPARRTYIPKKNGKLRPLGIPSIDDKLVQEVVRRILEAIYETNFSPKSHGFRPNKSCQTALNQIEGTFTACKWFIEGDIKGFFDNIDHQILINILKKRIDDEKFLRLIWKFLKAGYVEEWNFHKTISGTPQGGIISPILSNIYLMPPQNLRTGPKRKLIASGELRPTKKPDLDNLIKGIKDGCNKIIWHDDSQIVDMTVRKFYSEQPRAEVTIEWHQK
ncbi:reverse transcriptase domain-containing protein [Lysinibacillus fusiformis]|uniref:reverse transcriptase domain-containing protein n=1 Tax=Lysinibacillus fusiformis TaxID=28031 RepID=UPI003CFE09DA